MIPGFRLLPSVGFEWMSARLVDYYYGVHADEAMPGRPAYQGRDTVNVGAGIAADLRLNRSWSLLGGVHVTRFGSGIEDSPIVTRRFSALVHFGAGWRF